MVFIQISSTVQMLPGKTFHLPFFFDELFTFEEKELNKGVPTDDEKICILLYTDKNVLSLKKNVNCTTDKIAKSSVIRFRKC